MNTVDTQWEFGEWLWELRLGICNSIEGRDGEGGGKDVQVGRDLGKPMAYSCWCLVETNTIL